MSDPVPFGLGCLGWHVYRVEAHNLKKNIAKVWSKLPQEDDRPDIQAWLIQRAKGPWAVGSISYGATIAFYIRDKEDAMLFKLSQETQKPRFS